MSLTSQYDTKKSLISSYMDTSFDYKNTRFPGNSMGTCAAQGLYWLMGLAGQISSGEGEKKALLTTYQKATALQFGLLNNGEELTKICDSQVDLRGKQKAEALKSLTPYSGKYKLYGISNNKGEGHILGAYFPWSGRDQFYDPNLVAGPCTEDKWLWELLSMWPDLYTGVTNSNEANALWGFESLFVFSDPKKALEKLQAS